MVINKKIIRTMMENKSSYVGSLVLIILSCLLYTMLNQLSINMENITSQFEINYLQEDLSFIPHKKIENIEDIQKKFDLVMEETRVIDYHISSDKTLRIFSGNQKVNLPAIIEGEFYKENEIMIDPAYGKANSLKVGDSIKIYDREYRISGYVSLPNYIYPLKNDTDLLSDAKSFGIGVISKENFERINKGTSFYSIRFNGDLDDSKKEMKSSQLKEYLKSENTVILRWTEISENPRVEFVKVKIEGINQVSSVMPVFILLLTCVLTGIVIWRILKKEFGIIGTLYALGYRKYEILRHYLIYPISVGAIGGIVGTIAGAATLKPMMDFMVLYFNLPTDEMSFSIKYIAISILLPLILLTLSGYFVTVKALRFSPLELMRGGREKSKVGILEKRISLDRLKFTTKFKIREQLRSIPRSIFLIFGVMLATILLLFGFVAKGSIEFMMKDTYEGTYKYQYEYRLNTLKKESMGHAEGFSLSYFSLEGNDKIAFSVYGVNKTTRFLELKDWEGNKIDTGNVIITRPLADRLSVKTNDVIKVINKLDSREYEIKIDKIAQTYAGEYIYMPIDEFNMMLGYEDGSYMGLWSSEKLNLRDDEILSSATIEDFKKAFESMTEPLQASLGIMAFMSFVIGLIVIYVVTSLIIEENKNSISLMKVLGYKKKEVYSLILNSSTFMVVMGYILGVPLLLASLTVMFKSLTEGMNISFPVVISKIYVFVGFIIIYITFEISKGLNRKKINRISMSEALKTGVE